MFKELDNLINNSSLEKNTQKIRLYEGERREVTVLFADIKGFTNLSENLDPEQLKILLDKTMLIFTQSVKKYGGYVDKYEGDLIMALFGAKKATANDTERSILCALKMLENLKNINRIIENINHHFHLDIRIGINTGLVTTGKIGEKREGDFTVYGSAVNLASRMESNAPLNRIMLPESCVDIVKNKFSFELHGLIPVKGFSKPVNTFLVKQRLRSNLPLNRSLFVGRKSELSELNENYQYFKEKSSQAKPLVFIAGSAGIGKTRLIDEFISNKNNSFIYKLTSQFQYPTPYSSLKAFLRTIFDIQDNSSGVEIKKQIMFKINTLKSDVHQHTSMNIDIENIINLFRGQQLTDQVKSSDNDRLSLFSTVKDLILLCVAGKNELPAVIILDNYQELDELSKKFFDYLAEFIAYDDNPVKYNLLLILSSQTPVNRGGYLNKPFQLTMDLKPFDYSTTLKLIESLDSEKKFTNSQKKSLFHKSKGIPLFVVEFFYLYTESKDKQKFEDMEIPRSIKGLITSRYDNLDEKSKLVLQIASVFGSEFRYELITEIINKIDPIQSLQNTLEKLVELEFFHTTDRSIYYFVHNITRNVIYSLILKNNRKILHLKIAEEIEASGSDVINNYLYDLVEHYRQSETIEKYRYYLKSAGIYAHNNYDFKNAEVYLEKYYKLFKQNLCSDFKIEDVLEVLHYLVSVEMYLGKYKQVKDLTQQLLKLASTCNHIGYQADGYNYLGEQGKLDGDYNSAFKNFQTAQYLYNKIHNLYKQSVITGCLGEIELYQRNFQEAEKFFNKQLQQCNKLSDKKSEALGYYYNNMAGLYFQQDNFSKAVFYQLKDLAIAEKLNNKVDIAIETGNLGYSYMMLNDIKQADRYLNRYLQLCKKLFFKKGIMLAYDYLHILNFKQKNYSLALYYAQQQHKLAEQLSSKRDLAFSFSNLSRIYLKIGEVDKSKTLTEKSLTLVKEIEDVLGEMVLKAELAKIYKYKHDYIRAEKNFIQVLNKLGDLNSPGHFCDVLCQLAELYLITGQTDKLISCLKNTSPDQCSYDNLTNFQINLLINLVNHLNGINNIEQVIEQQNEASLDLPQKTIFNFYLFLTSRTVDFHFTREQISDFKNKSVNLLKSLTGGKKIYPYYFYLEIIEKI